MYSTFRTVVHDPPPTWRRRVTFQVRPAFGLSSGRYSVRYDSVVVVLLTVTDRCTSVGRPRSSQLVTDVTSPPGLVTDVNFPALPGLRYDSYMRSGASIPPFYDSMIAKVIAHGATREEARQRLLGALSQLKVDGIKTNVALHRTVLAHHEFVQGGMDTGFLGRFLAEGFKP